MGKVYILTALMAFSATTLSFAVPQAESKQRVIDKPLSDESHFDEMHEHNEEYDHEAFLGREEVKSFDQLTPEESKQRLSIIYDKIDSDNDGMVVESELIDWIKGVQLRYVASDTDRQWLDYGLPDDATLSWDTYLNRTYGQIDDTEDREEEGSYNYRDMIKRDKRRWGRADQTQDAVLTKQEFSDFIHPEEVEHMKEIIVDETLEDIDKNKDGSISLEEYIGDMWPNKAGDEEPDWVKTEREQFTLYRDKNKDGRMDRGEVKDWIIPPDYDHSVAEAQHLIQEADTDRDAALSREEVLEKYDLFVGSQATDFGEALVKHDEF